MQEAAGVPTDQVPYDKDLVSAELYPSLSGVPATTGSRKSVSCEQASGRTLVFCTAFADGDRNPPHGWNVRYKRWLDALLQSKLKFDQILIIDDGSPTLPDWPGVHVLTDLPRSQPAVPVVLFHFDTNLGRNGVYEYPGWYRSFAFAAMYADRYHFDKLIHIESDAFLVSDRIQNYFNAVADGWIALWSPRYDYPETGVQIIAGSAVEAFKAFCAHPYSEFSGRPIEPVMPFTKVERQFVGDRYGEYLSYVPQDADWTMQTFAPSSTSDGYFWWLQKRHQTKDAATFAMDVGGDLDHRGVNYLDFMSALSRTLAVRTYLEIGTNTGESLKRFPCDSICIDPQFAIEQSVLAGRRRAFFFQMTSDDFFSHYDVRSMFPGGLDVAFLDGLHHFEALLRDFMNAERYCHKDSVILLHDCLPTNHRMAERNPRIDEAEDPATRHSWTGDVWRLLPVLHKYRPDLRIFFLDCGPTGLVVCTNMNPHSQVLPESYVRIVEEFSAVDLPTLGLDRLWRIFPTLDSRRLCDSMSDVPGILFS